MPHDWRITLCYVAILLVSFILMKAVNAVESFADRQQRATYLLFAPLLSIRVWNQRTPINRPKFLRMLLSVSLALPTLVLVYWKFPSFLQAHELPWMLRSYLAVVPFVVLLESIGAVTQLACIPTCGALPPLLNRPHLSRSLAEFWGQRWNPWLGGWFREVCFRRYRRRPELGTFIAFGASGIWHELLVSVPLWIVFRESVFGFMAGYFLLQAAGLLIERRFTQYPFLTKSWLWVIVLTPVPLVLNRGTLLIFHFSPP